MSGSSRFDQPTGELPNYGGGVEEGESLDAVPPGAAPSDTTPPATDAPEPQSTGRGPFWLVAAILAVVVLGLLAIRAVGLLPDFSNPFAERETNRSQPALLKSIQDLSRYVAAEGHFQDVIDVQRNRENVPELLLNERTLFVAAGSVEAYVDFSKLGEDAIVISEDGKSAKIRLPAPQLGEVNLDQENSYVFAEERGLLNRLRDAFGTDPNRQQAVYLMAEDRIAAVAKQSGLSERAQTNTTKMLEGLLRSLGFETVTVTYVAP